MSRARNTLRLPGLALVLLACPLLSRAQTLNTESPFLAVSSSKADPALTQGDFELTGISSIGDKKLVCLFDRTKKKSRWVGLGAKADGIELLSCDITKGEASVSINGSTKLLTLKKSSADNAGLLISMPGMSETGPAGGKLPPVLPLTTKEEQEREARMLVADLLEIGQRQRKAYEEAQRKAGIDAAAAAAAKK